MEVILGKERRRWSAEEKRAIVAETVAAGGVTRVARRHGANPAMVFAWRKQFGVSKIEASRAPAFVPVEVIAAPAVSAPDLATAARTVSPTPAIGTSPASAPVGASSAIDVEIGADIRLRIKAGAEPALAAAVAKALRG